MSCGASRTPFESSPTTAATAASTVVEDGYKSWLRYRRLPATPATDRARAQLSNIHLTIKSSKGHAISEELERASLGLFGAEPAWTDAATATLIVATAKAPILSEFGLEEVVSDLGDGYAIVLDDHKGVLVVVSETEVGALYGTFALLWHVSMGRPLAQAATRSLPRIAHRLLNHWDNLDGSVERGRKVHFSLGRATGKSVASLPRLCSSQRISWHQRRGLDQRQRERPRAHARESEQGRKYRRRVAPFRRSRVLDRPLQCSHRDRRPEDGRPTRPRGQNLVEEQDRRNLRARSRLRWLRRESQLRGATGTTRLRSKSCRGGKPTRACAGSSWGHRDVASLRLQR